MFSCCFPSFPSPPNKFEGSIAGHSALTLFGSQECYGRGAVCRGRSISSVSYWIDLCCARRLTTRLPSTMLFKTISASVYGIDAYIVEVEVDVGSARMQDFNVVGLPDNAVKESRERIKSALRNCGFEFPHGQGVTINLAPADVRKEGSAFDLPMALGLAGCMGQFSESGWTSACSWESCPWMGA